MKDKTKPQHNMCWTPLPVYDVTNDRQGGNRVHLELSVYLYINKGNNKITELRKILQNLTDKISQQPENCENRNDPDLVQAFLKKWWVESDFKAPNILPHKCQIIPKGQSRTYAYSSEKVAT
jgi:hypothetical protein